MCLLAIQALVKNQLLTRPQVVQMPYDALELHRNLDVDVLIEARLEAALLRERRPIVATRLRRAVAQLRLAPLQFGRLAVQLLLAALQLSG